MWKYILKKGKDKILDEFLAPETKPVISVGRLFVRIGESADTPAEKISYKLLKRRRRQHIHSFQ